MPFTMLGQMMLMRATSRLIRLNMKEDTVSITNPKQSIQRVRILPSILPTKKVVTNAAMPRGLIA